MFSVMSLDFSFPASSDTLIVRVHSSDIVVHDVMFFQFIDKEILQFLLTLSFREATKTSQI